MTTPYRGRFAPSPTGPLHFGSLVAALASYLDAKAHQGRWLVRIEDIDPLREIPGATEAILRSLEAHGLIWDEPVVWQSQRTEQYWAVLERLSQQGCAYLCPCSRQDLKALGGQHLPRCGVFGDAPTQPTNTACATRFRLPNTNWAWTDRLFGQQQVTLHGAVDDFVLRRREGYPSYQLAVVTDDIAQGITHVVRGSDLLESTAMQLALYQALGVTPPAFAHLPVATGDDDQKLSKQNHAPALDDRHAAANLHAALCFLSHPPPDTLAKAAVNELLAWGITNWSLSRLRACTNLPAPTHFR